MSTDKLKTRVKKLNYSPKSEGRSVVYVMSRDQRVRDNHALIASQNYAIGKNVTLIVAFILYPKVKNRLLNQYLWMVEGLKKVEKDLKDLNIPFKVFTGKADECLKEMESEFEPVAFFSDFSPLKGPTLVKSSFSKRSETPFYVVDTHNIIPVWEISDREEFAAYTIRPKIYKQLGAYLIEPEKLQKQEQSLKVSDNNWEKLIESIKAPNSKNYNPIVESGEDKAFDVLEEFIQNRLEDYATKRNDPTENYQSNLSAYLHFGQISSLRVVLELLKFAKKEGLEIDLDQKRNKAKVDIENKNKSKKEKIKESIEALIEEIVVRKELSDNFCFFNKNYNNFEGGKDWARKSLLEHENDRREFIYSIEEFENAKTHDKAWNAAQIQMITTGKMHGYMRMYWAKKILEWSNSAKEALEIALYLNDKYHLDGYDPNGYAGIMWSILGVHDRVWFDRPIFGKIRYMNYEGLKRKFDLNKFIEKYQNPKQNR